MIFIGIAFLCELVPLKLLYWAPDQKDNIISPANDTLPLNTETF